MDLLQGIIAPWDFDIITSLQEDNQKYVLIFFNPLDQKVAWDCEVMKKVKAESH